MPKRPRGSRNADSIGQPHNNFFAAHFKKAAQAQELLALFMTTAQLDLFDLDTLTVETNTQTSPHNLRGSYSDLTLRVRLKEGLNIVICLVLEHKSHPDSKALNQLLRYIAASYEDDDVDAVLPIVIYNGEETWTQQQSFYETRHAHLPKSFLDFSGAVLLNFTVIFVSLMDPIIRQRLLLLAPKERLVLQVMIDIWRAGLQQFIGWVQLMRRLPVRWRGDLLRSIHLYFTSVQSEGKMEAIYRSFKEQQTEDRYMQEILTELEQILPMTGRELQMHGRQVGFEEGKVEGIIEGKAEGFVEGKAEGLIQGKAEGRQEAEKNLYECVRKFFEMGWSNKKVAEFTQLSVDEVRKLRNGT